MNHAQYITVHGSDDIISLPDRFTRLMSEIINKKLLMCGTIY